MSTWIGEAKKYNSQWKKQPREQEKNINGNINLNRGGKNITHDGNINLKGGCKKYNSQWKYEPREQEQNINGNINLNREVKKYNSEWKYQPREKAKNTNHQRRQVSPTLCGSKGKLIKDQQQILTFKARISELYRKN